MSKQIFTVTRTAITEDAARAVGTEPLTLHLLAESDEDAIQRLRAQSGYDPDAFEWAVVDAALELPQKEN